MARRIAVEIVGDSRSLERAFRRSERAAAGFNTSVTRMTGRISGGFGSLAAAAGVSFGVAGIVGFAKQAINASSNLREELSKNQQIFGRNAAEIEAWSKTAAETMKISQRSAVQTASTFGGLLRTVGFVGDAAADQAKDLTQLGADLASFFNTDVQQALDAIRSGLVGESEPLRRYNVLLSEAAVQQEAMAITGKRSARELTQQDKVLARLNIIFRQTKQAQGDVARTGDQLAGQQRELRARLEDTLATLGERLTPTVLDYLTRLNDWLADTENVEGMTRKLDSALGVMEKTVETLTSAVEGLAEAYRKMGKAGHYSFQDLYKDAVKLGDRLPLGSWRPKELHHVLPDFTPSTGTAGTFREWMGGDTAGGTVGPRVAPPARRPGPGLTRAQRMERGYRWFDSSIARMLDRVQDIPMLRDQIRRLREIAAIVQERMAATKDVTRRLALEDQLTLINRDIWRKRQQRQQNLSDKAAEDKAKAKQRFENLMGWLELDIDKAAWTKTNSDNIAKLKVAEKAILAEIKRTKLTLDLARRLFKVRDEMKNLSRKEEGEGWRETGFHRQSPARLAAMLGLGGDRYAMALLSQIGRGGKTPTRGGQYAGVIIQGNVNVNGVQDVAGFENEMRKQGRGQAHSRRAVR